MAKTAISNILVIIPCFNEESNVSELHRQLKDLGLSDCSVTPLFINDASRDSTVSVLRSLGVPYLDNAVNLGIGGTVQLGFIYAMENNFDIAVQMDGDGQHPPAELYKLLQPVVNGETDVTVGSRFINNDGFRSTFLRRIGIKLFLFLNKWLSGITIHDATSGYRAFNRKAIELLAEYYPDEYPEPEVIVYLANKKLRIKEVPVIMHERKGGTSSIGRTASLYYMAKVTLNTLFLQLRMKNG